MNHDDTVFTAALRERVRDEDPDLDQLIQVSTRTGTRMRRRRTLGMSVAGVAAGVAVVGIIGASLGGSGSTPGTEPGVAADPTPTVSSVAPKVPEDVVPPTSGQVLPVRVARSLKGWEIGIAADDKFPVNKGKYALSVNVRRMSEYAAWSGGDPDRPSSQVVHVGDNYFVTLQPGQSVPPAVIAELTEALRYDARWTKRAH
jgi:hypothetical protein